MNSNIGGGNQQHSSSSNRNGSVGSKSVTGCSNVSWHKIGVSLESETAVNCDPFGTPPPAPPPPAVGYGKYRQEMSLPNSCLQCPSIRTTASTSYRSPRSIIYVYELPYNVRKAICDLLDADNSWRELGGSYMGFNDTQLTLVSHALYRSASPTNELLTKWESSNAKVAHLYHYLAMMKHRRAMYHLLPYVNEQLRDLYSEFEQQQSHLCHTEQHMAQLEQHHRPLESKQAAALRHSTLKDNITPNVFYFDNFGHNKQSDEELTLIDLNNDKRNSFQLDPNRSQAEEEYLMRIEDFKIPYKELVIATDDFAKENILGSGGFGTVFIGEWKGTKVAVKKLKGLDNQSQALTEFRILNCCRIDNILPLYAVSFDGPEPCLVYQYMPNGSLEDRLLCKNTTTPLTWLQRAKIGEGVARALNFLHTLKGNPFVHGDVKSANILLDLLFEPKLGDFGLARQVKKNTGNNNSMYTHCTVSSVNGTSVYLPAEYLRHKILSPAVDVYSYGIVVLEMVTGRRAYDGKKLLINSVEDEYGRVQSVMSNAHNTDTCTETLYSSLMDRRIVELTDDRHWFNYLLELGRKCAHRTKSKRPIMIQILEYFNQCKSTNRIQRLCDKAFQNRKTLSKINLSKSNLKSPFELQMWYEFVRKSCGTLSEIVFENFDAQVTKMIEEMCSGGDSSESRYYIDVLLNSKHSLASAKGQQSSAITASSSRGQSGSDSFVSSEESYSCSNAESDSLPQMLERMRLCSESDNTDCQTEVVASSGVVAGTNQSTPIIPLLTALGFNSTDIDQLVEP